MMMYLLFVHCHILPSEYLKLRHGERTVLHSFCLKHFAPKAYENLLWQAEAEAREEEEACPMYP